LAFPGNPQPDVVKTSLKAQGRRAGTVKAQLLIAPVKAAGERGKNALKERQVMNRPPRHANVPLDAKADLKVQGQKARDQRGGALKAQPLTVPAKAADKHEENVLKERPMANKAPHRVNVPLDAKAALRGQGQKVQDRRVRDQGVETLKAQPPTVPAKAAGKCEENALKERPMANKAPHRANVPLDTKAALRAQGQKVRDQKVRDQKVQAQRVRDQEVRGSRVLKAQLSTVPVKATGRHGERALKERPITKRKPSHHANVPLAAKAGPRAQGRKARGQKAGTVKAQLPSVPVKVTDKRGKNVLKEHPMANRPPPCHANVPLGVKAGPRA
jgi:hypothetical protein